MASQKISGKDFPLRFCSYSLLCLDKDSRLALDGHTMVNKHICSKFSRILMNIAR